MSISAHRFEPCCPKKQSQFVSTQTIGFHRALALTEPTKGAKFSKENHDLVVHEERPYLIQLQDVHIV
jgi:hypothetical protein